MSYWDTQIRTDHEIEQETAATERALAIALLWTSFAGGAGAMYLLCRLLV